MYIARSPDDNHFEFMINRVSLTFFIISFLSLSLAHTFAFTTRSHIEKNPFQTVRICFIAASPFRFAFIY